MSTDIDHTRVKSEAGFLAASPSNATPTLICDDHCSCTVLPLFNNTLCVLFRNISISAWCLFVFQTPPATSTLIYGDHCFCTMPVLLNSIVQSYSATPSTMDGISLEGRPLLKRFLHFQHYFSQSTVLFCWECYARCFLADHCPLCVTLCHLTVTVTVNIFCNAMQCVLADHCPSCVTSCYKTVCYS